MFFTGVHQKAAQQQHIALISVVVPREHLVKVIFIMSGLSVIFKATELRSEKDSAG